MVGGRDGPWILGDDIISGDGQGCLMRPDNHVECVLRDADLCLAKKQWRRIVSGMQKLGQPLALVLKSDA